MAHDRERFNCQACRNNRHCDDSNPAPFPMFALPEVGLESRTCLLPMVKEDSRQLVKLYGHYKAGYLPYAGGVLDQPAAFNEAMELIENQLAKMRARQES